MTVARQAAARSLLWTGLESAFLSGISLVALVVFAWLLSPAQIGVVSIGLGIIQLLNVLVESLYQDALIQRHEVEDRHFDTALTASLLLALLLAALCWAGADRVAAVIGVAELEPVIAALGLCLIPPAFTGPLVARLRRQMDFRTLALRSLGGRIVGAVLGIAVALGGGGLWALVVQHAAMVTVGAVALWTMSDYRPRLRFSPRHFGALLAFGLRSAAVAFGDLASPRIFVVLVGSTLGPTSVGYIDIAFRMVDMLRGVVGTAVQQFALPLFGRFGTSAEKRRAGFAEATRFTCMTTFPFFAGLALCAPEVVSILFDPAWMPAVPYIALMAALVLPHFARLYAAPVLTAVDTPQAALPPLLAGFVVVVLGTLAIGWVSLPAAATVWAARLLVTVPLDAWMVRRVADIGYRAQFGVVLRPLLATLLMAVAVLTTRFFLLESQGLPARSPRW
jgi:PST family polysaccharide transporter